MPVEMTPLNSSNIASAGYDPLTGRLYVTFLSGATYSGQVPAETAAELIASPSPGSFYARSIRNRYSMVQE